MQTKYRIFLKSAALTAAAVALILLGYFGAEILM